MANVTFFFFSFTKRACFSFESYQQTTGLITLYHT